MRSLKSRATAGLTALLLAAGSMIGPGSLALADSTVPDSPTGLTIAPSPITTDGTAVLNWTAPTNETIDHYQIFRANGSGAADADGVTYIANTTNTYFIDAIPTEGTFQYTVIAVDDDGQASQESNWVVVVNDLPDNGSVIDADTTAPAVPTALNLGDEFSRSRSLTLTWNEQTEPDLRRFLIYRSDNGGDKQLIGYVPGEDNQYTETVDADGSYVYSVRSQDVTGNVSAYSAGKRVEVDTVAPTVSIITPENGATYTGTGSLLITVEVEEYGAGYTTGGVKYYLDDRKIHSPTLDLGSLDTGNHSVRVTVTDRAGNTGDDAALFIVGRAAEEPDAPQRLTIPAYSKSRSVTLTWSAPETSGVKNYLIYRAKAGTGEQLAGTTSAGVRTFRDTVDADGVYSYYVVATYSDGDLVASLPVTTTVDTVAPVIAIHAPTKTTYTADDAFIAIDVDVTDTTSGESESDRRYYLNGRAFTSEIIDLEDLSDGEYTFKVEAADRAGNKAIRSVTFTVDGYGTGDDDDDGDGRPVPNSEMLALLEELEGEITPGHYTALTAFARNGNMFALKNHVIKFRGKFISEEAADQILELLGDNASVPGKGKGSGNGKGKGPKR